MNRSPSYLPNTLLALGDSYTIGEGVQEYERWPWQMVEELKRRDLTFELRHMIAQTGWTTDELQSVLGPFEFDDRYGLVTLLIGVNNQYRGESTAKFRAEFRQLLEFAIEKTGGNSNRVLVLSIPDWGVTPFARDRDRNKIAVEIDEFNLVKKEETERLNALFVDITDISGRGGLEAGWLAQDGLHPSTEMYRMWALRAVDSWLKQECH